MPKFYLPYARDNAPGSILVHGERALHFPSRTAALAFVMEHLRDDRMLASKAVISIEGQDGLWRSFDTSLLPARESA